MSRVAKSSTTNQTLDRGLRALELIAEASAPPTVEQLGEALGIHRSMAYRIVRTLEDHGLVRRDDRGRCMPWTRLIDLARGVQFSLHSLARPELRAIAAELGLTTFAVVAVGDEAVTIDSVEPPRTDAVIAFRPGTRHSLDSGAPGLALLAGRPPVQGERPEVAEARARGWAESSGEVVEGLGSLATWIDGSGDEPIAALACLFLGSAAPDPERVAARLRLGARTISKSVTN